MTILKDLRVLAFCASALAGCHPAQSVGILFQNDAHTPLPWRPLTPTEQAQFDSGYAVFNTEWVPAGHPSGRIDGLGPLFNAQSCDACHNSRRRGRGPRGDGDAPADLVIQLGRRLSDGSVERGSQAYGHVLNTSAVEGFTPEASVSIHYDDDVRTLTDGTHVTLHVPHYDIKVFAPGKPLSGDMVIMPRMPPSVQGVGLLELVPSSELVRAAESALRRRSRVGGRVSWVDSPDGKVIGRFGWQATEPTVAMQTARAFAREMGLTTDLVASIDCGRNDSACWTAPNGGTPEVEPALFESLVFFEKVHAVPGAKYDSHLSKGERLFTRIGCADCHRPSLPVETNAKERLSIRPYTDLLLHELGSGLADCDVEGKPVRSEWRTAPLWGLNAAMASGQPIRLLHDGRARTVEEAILWHDGEALDSRERYAQLRADDRHVLAAWISQQ